MFDSYRLSETKSSKMIYIVSELPEDTVVGPGSLRIQSRRSPVEFKLLILFLRFQNVIAHFDGLLGFRHLGLRNEWGKWAGRGSYRTRQDRKPFRRMGRPLIYHLHFFYTQKAEETQKKLKMEKDTKDLELSNYFPPEWCFSEHGNKSPLKSRKNTRESRK